MNRLEFFKTLGVVSLIPFIPFTLGQRTKRKEQVILIGDKTYVIEMEINPDESGVAVDYYIDLSGGHSVRSFARFSSEEVFRSKNHAMIDGIVKTVKDCFLRHG